MVWLGVVLPTLPSNHLRPTTMIMVIMMLTKTLLRILVPLTVLALSPSSWMRTRSLRLFLLRVLRVRLGYAVKLVNYLIF